MVDVVIFDPRYKLQIVEWDYEKAYGEKYKYELEIINGNLFALFNSYLDESKLNNSKVGQPTSGSLNY